jgi:flagellar hook-associated protein 3 FlgL
MIAGIYAFNGAFLADLATTESRIGQTNRQISSGIRVNQASDDPTAVAPIIAYGGEITQIQQVQSNLDSAGTEATAADGALQAASTLIDQLTTIAAQGSNSDMTASSRSSLGTQVQQIEQQLVGLANTQVAGRFIFGGDASSVAPYTYNWTATGATTANSPGVTTEVLRDTGGNEIVPRMTAQQIFDAQSGGVPAPGNVFQTVYSLGQALLTNNQAAVQSAAVSLKACVTQLGQATTFYGNAENWIKQAGDQATEKLTTLQQALSSVRDTDLASAATQLSLEQVALNAAVSAHGSLNTKSLFDYIG